MSSSKTKSKRRVRTNKSNYTKRTRRKYSFKKKDYNANDGILTSVWGPALWHFLHSMSFNYPISPTSAEKKSYKMFIKSLVFVLPCKYCRINLTKNFKKLPLTDVHLKNRDAFSKYIFYLHEHVNKMLNKQSNLSFLDVRDRYEHFRSRCSVDDKIKNVQMSLNHNITKKCKKTRKNVKIIEKGCTEPLHGKKAKCVINIVPQDGKQNNLVIDRKCIHLTTK